MYFRMIMLFGGLFIFIFSNALIAQTGFLKSHIKYLSYPPVIDGVLDSNLVDLKIREFPVINKSDDGNPDVSPNYRLAYGANFFYVYIEAEASNLIYRDRAYQNGDGFHMVLARPKSDGQPTDEFYVLACSAVNKKSMEWSRNIFWYYNVDNIFVPTSKDTRMNFAEKDGKISFELILPWKDVYPYHPWLSEGIGFNLCFIKAIGKHGKNYYQILEDEMGAENSKRKYVNLKFEKPIHIGEPKTYFILNKNNIKGNELPSGSSVTVAAADFEEDLIVKIMTGDNYRLDYSRQQYKGQKGLTYNNFNVSNEQIPAGGYKIEWYSRNNTSKGNSYLTSIPEFNKKLFIEELAKIKANLTISSYETLKHRIQEIDRELREIEAYETCGKQRIAISEIKTLIEKGKKGVNVIAAKRGFVRKAYQSKLDKTLQPYMVYLPTDYNPENNYPLVLYLHGSASDETNIMSMKHLIPDGFIGLAPNGRGPSNCYTWDNAQADISEALNAVMQSYSIDKDKVLLTGFSMGGYGVYRTYFEMPNKFQALAVFSGHPDIANKWQGEENLYPNFTQIKYLKKFKDVPIFIFHGKEDRNCLFETTRNLIEKLKKAGARVKFVSEDDKGHEKPGEKTIHQYYEWVKKNLSN